MRLPETRITSEFLPSNARARYLMAKEMFQTADPSLTPDSQALIDIHQQWLDQQLGSIGINARDKNLYVVFRDVEVKDKNDKPALRRIERQARASVDNILQGLLWYEAPEFAAWNKPRMKFVAHDVLIAQSAATSHMRKRKEQGGWVLSDWNSSENYKSLIVGHHQEIIDQQALYTFQVNEHHPGVQGSFDYTDSKRKHIGVKAYFNPHTQLFEVAFEGYSDFIGWDQIEGEEPIYRLTYVRNMIRDMYERIKLGEKEFIQFTTWRAY